MDDIKLTLYSVYFGRLPDWLPFTLFSFSYNKNCKLVIVNDMVEDGRPYPNVQFVKCTKSEFTKIVKCNLGISYKYELKPRKICDFKPTYLRLFSKFQEGLFWGYSDIDIYWGDLLNEINMSKYNIISFRNNGISGHCAIWNRDLYEHPFLLNSSWKKYLSSDKYEFFDEDILAQEVKGKIDYDQPGQNRINEFWGMDSFMLPYLKDAAIWEKGKLYQVGMFKRREISYFHFINWKKGQRNMPKNLSVLGDARIFISSDGVSVQPTSVFLKISTLINVENIRFILARLKRDIIRWSRRIIRSLKRRGLIY